MITTGYDTGIVRVSNVDEYDYDRKSDEDKEAIVKGMREDLKVLVSMYNTLAKVVNK